MCMECRRFSQTMASEWQIAFVVSHKMPWCALLTAVKNCNKSWKTARLFLQDRDQDQDQMFKTFKTKTSWSKTKTFIFVLEAPRDQDPGLEDCITGKLWSYWWFSQEGASQTRRSVLEISINSSVISWSHSHYPYSFQTHPHRGKRRAFSVANVFSGSVATQLRWSAKLCTSLETRNTGILCAKHYKDQFKLPLRKPTGPFGHIV